MKNTTNTSGSIEKNAKLKEIPSVAELDIRDYFAAKAMQALLTALAAHAVSDNVAVARSYAMADAMLEAREK